jgi:hypothetical protein
VAVSSLDGHKPHLLRTHRASPLPRRAARKSVTPEQRSERILGEAAGEAAVPALPRFFDRLSDEERELQDALRLHEVGIEARAAQHACERQRRPAERGVPPR